jgi:hypothetical protein
MAEKKADTDYHYSVTLPFFVDYSYHFLVVLQPLRLIHALERWYRLALVFIESRSNNLAVLQVDVRTLNILVEAECVLHPVFVVALEGEKCQRDRRSCNKS